MRALIQTAPFVLAAACGWGQTPEAVIRQFAGQQLIFPKGGDEFKVKVRKSQLDRLPGNCDRAVEVTEAKWKAGTARFRLRIIGTPIMVDQHAGGCRISHDDTELEISDFAPDEPADSLLNAVHQMLQTPEEYLLANGVQFDLPPGTDDQTPVKRVPGMVFPKVLLRVEGVYTPAARAAKQKGAVAISLVVGTDGRVHKALVQRGLGLGLDENAMRVLPLWRFEPGRLADKPVAYHATVEMHFDIF